MALYDHPPATAQCTVTVRPADAHDYDADTPVSFGDVPGEPLAEFLAALVEGVGERGMNAMRTIADDDQHGPIHLVRLVAAVEHTARTLGGGLLGGESHSAQNALLITSDVSPDGLPGLVAALRSEGLHSATETARNMSSEDRMGVLDAISHYAFAFWFAAATASWDDLGYAP